MSNPAIIIGVNQQNLSGECISDHILPNFKFTELAGLEERGILSTAVRSATETLSVCLKEEISPNDIQIINRLHSVCHHHDFSEAVNNIARYAEINGKISSQELLYMANIAVNFTKTGRAPTEIIASICTLASLKPLTPMSEEDLELLASISEEPTDLAETLDILKLYLFRGDAPLHRKDLIDEIRKLKEADGVNFINALLCVDLWLKQDSEPITADRMFYCFDAAAQFSKTIDSLECQSSTEQLSLYLAESQSCLQSVERFQKIAEWSMFDPLSLSKVTEYIIRCRRPLTEDEFAVFDKNLRHEGTANIISLVCEFSNARNDILSPNQLDAHLEVLGALSAKLNSEKMISDLVYDISHYVYAKAPQVMLNGRELNLLSNIAENLSANEICSYFDTVLLYQESRNKDKIGVAKAEAIAECFLEYKGNTISGQELSKAVIAMEKIRHKPFSKELFIEYAKALNYSMNVTHTKKQPPQTFMYLLAEYSNEIFEGKKLIPTPAQIYKIGELLKPLLIDDEECLASHIKICLKTINAWPKEFASLGYAAVLTA